MIYYVFYILLFKMNEYCPNFNIGKCTNNNCKYNYHIKCKDNYLCNNIDCKLGHGISFIKRDIICKIYNMENDNFHDSNKKCKNPITCYNKNCKFDHQFNFKERDIINIIIKKNDNEALDFYNNKITQPNIKCKILSSYNIIENNNPSPVIINNKSFKETENDTEIILKLMLEKQSVIMNNELIIEKLKEQFNKIKMELKIYEVENNKIKKDIKKLSFKISKSY